MVRDVTGHPCKRYSEIRANKAYRRARGASYQVDETLRSHELPDPRWNYQGVIPLRRFSHTERHELLPSPVRPSQNRRMADNKSDQLSATQHWRYSHAERDSQYTPSPTIDYRTMPRNN